MKIETKIRLVQEIGNEICEGCNEDRDCGEELSECFRVINALVILNTIYEKGFEAGSAKQAILELAGRDKFLESLTQN